MSRTGARGVEQVEVEDTSEAACKGLSGLTWTGPGPCGQRFRLAGPSLAAGPCGPGHAGAACTDAERTNSLIRVFATPSGGYFVPLLWGPAHLKPLPRQLSSRRLPPPTPHSPPFVSGAVTDDDDDDLFPSGAEQRASAVFSFRPGLPSAPPLQSDPVLSRGLRVLSPARALEPSAARASTFQESQRLQVPCQRGCSGTSQAAKCSHSGASPLRRAVLAHINGS